MLVVTKRMLQDQFGLSRRQAIQVHRLNSRPDDPCGMMFQTAASLQRAVDKVLGI